MNKWSRFKFTPNLPLGANGERVTGSKAHIELSKEAAKEGMVLLKNENDVLPIEKGRRVALLGIDAEKSIGNQAFYDVKNAVCAAVVAP